MADVDCRSVLLSVVFLFFEQDPGNNANTTYEPRELRENRMGWRNPRVVLLTVSFFRLVRVFRGLFFSSRLVAAMLLQEFRAAYVISTVTEH